MMLSGNNGILQRAVDSKEKTTVAGEKEQIQLEVLGSYENDGTLLIVTVNSNIKSHISGVTTDDASEFPLTVTYIATGNKYEVYGDGKVDVKGTSVTEYVKVGDYVDYDPTYSDAQKTQKVNASKLTYTSPTGTATEHGNGYTSSETGGGQKFTAKSGLKWRILNITEDNIEIIPTQLIKTDNTSKNSGNFVLNSARGYLYEEQELNEICKIYGYGYGANIDQITSFKVGGPYPGEEVTKTITDSGARSITVHDINKIAKVGEIADGVNVKTEFSELSSKYGSTKTLGSKVYFPTINPSLGNNITGISNSVGIKTLKYTNFGYYYSTKIEEEEMRDLLFNGKYWLATRNTAISDSGTISYSSYVINVNILNSTTFCDGNNRNLVEYSYQSDYSIRPVVTLKVNAIDVTNVAETSGKEENAWKLK